MPRVAVPLDPIDLAAVETDDGPLAVTTSLEDQFAEVLAHWAANPVDFVCQGIRVQPDPWQCDVMDAILIEDNVALRSCHGAGKTAVESWIVIWFLVTHAMSQIVPTAPTFNKQVRDVLWATNIRAWWSKLAHHAPWIYHQFTPLTTRLQHKKHSEWFAVGVASSTPINTEGYHAPHLLAVFDEAKGVKRLAWEAIQGMRTTQAAKFLVGSTPGGPV